MSAKDTSKKVVSFLLLRPAVNRRNLTTILLVMSLVLIAWLSGMRVDLVPKVKRGSAFGAAADVSQGKPRGEQGIRQPQAYDRGGKRVSGTGSVSSGRQGGTGEDDTFADIRRRLENRNHARPR
ncbi:MAG: hypothetical protein PHC51_04610 [bacterium]|nr:hypothetical protein [bacterium]